MNTCNVPGQVTTEATRSLYHTVAHQSAAILVDPPATGQILLPGNVEVVPTTITNSSQDIKANDKNKVVLGKKRKIPSTTLNESVASKGKVSTDAQHTFQDVKMGCGDLHMVQETNQTKLGNVDSGRGPAGEEKRKVKEREKDRIREKEKERQKEREKERRCKSKSSFTNGGWRLKPDMESSKRVEETVRPVKIGVEDPARKTRTMPTYKLRSDIEQTTT